MYAPTISIDYSPLFTNIAPIKIRINPHAKKTSALTFEKSLDRLTASGTKKAAAENNSTAWPIFENTEDNIFH